MARSTSARGATLGRTSARKTRCHLRLYIADRSIAEETVRASNARLREMVAELEHFSYAISHDMRAPLRAMKSFAVLLQHDFATCTYTKRSDMLNRISTAASRLDALIQGSLEYAKVVREALPLQPVDLAKLISGLLQTYLM